MKFTRRLTVTTLIRRTIRIATPAQLTCSVCGSEIVTTKSLEPADDLLDRRRNKAEMDGVGVNSVQEGIELGKKE